MRSVASSAAEVLLKSRLWLFLSLVLVIASASAVFAYFSFRSLLLVLWPLSAVAVLFVVIMVFPACQKRDALFQLVIGIFGLLLLLSSTLISNDLLGWDVHQEFNLSSNVLASGVWHPEVQSQYNSVLSVTILPAMISSVSNVDLIWVFKVIFPVLFSLVPVVVYRVYRSILAPEAAFLCSFLLASYPAFYLELISLARQEVATILLVLALFVFFSPSIREGSRGTALTLLMTVGIVTAHYSVAYIYLALLALSLTLPLFSKSTTSLVPAPILLLVGVITAFWYGLFVSPYELISLGQLFSWMVNGILYDFLNPGSRPAILSLAVSQYRPGLLGGLNRALYYAMNLAIVLGFLAFIRKSRKTAAERRFYSLLVLAFLLLGLSVLLPYFAASLDIQRIYLLVLLFASPCFVMGLDAFVRLLGRLRLPTHAVRMPRTIIQFRWITAATILLCYFMFTSGWVWALTMTAPSSFVLDSSRMASYPDDSVKAYFFSYYTAPQDIAGARWLKQYSTTDRVVCADWNSRLNVLTSYGGLSRGLSNGPMLPSSCDFTRAYVYLSLLNTVYRVGTQGNWSVSILPIDTLNRVYSDTSTVYI
jgi:uncharacterized membrane protein